jgi:hypothetical protein
MKRDFALAIAGVVNVIFAIGMGVAFVFSLVCEPLGNGLILSNLAPVDPIVQMHSLNKTGMSEQVVLPAIADFNASNQYQTVKQVDQVQGIQDWSEVSLPEEKTFALGDCSVCHGRIKP